MTDLTIILQGVIHSEALIYQIIETQTFKLEICCSEDRKFRHHLKDIPTNLFENKHMYSNYMAQLFNIYPINRGDCHYNFKGITYFNDKVKDNIEYFMEGCDC